MLYKFAKKEKKILKTNNLIEKLIKLDFLILEKDSLFFKNSKYIHFYTKINKKKIILSLDPLILLNGLKQLIRTCFFLQRSKKGLLNIVSKNLNYTSIIKNLLVLNENKVNVFSSQLFFQSNKINIKKLNSLFIINDEISIYKNFYNKSVDKSIFLITKMNSLLENQNWGFYKIFNSTDDLKKLIFIISFFNLIYSTKKLV